MNTLINILLSSWGVLGEMAPYLLFGFAVAGVLSVFMSAEWVKRHLGHGGIAPIVKAAIFGVPLPLCSCSVIPVTIGIRDHGAGRGAATSFLLSTPQTGVDSIMATYALLGPVYAIFRPLMALVTGIAGGLAVSLTEGWEADGGETMVSHESACATKSGTLPGRVIQALRYGFITLPRDLARALLIGILIAGAISALIPPGALEFYLGGGILAMLIMMLVGVPLYVCSTASIPIAVGFMHMGASPGAALVFLIAGPATNAATISVVWNILGRRTAIIYLSTVVIGSLTSGLILDWLFAELAAAGVKAGPHAHEMGARWFMQVSAIALLAVLAGSIAEPRITQRLNERRNRLAAANAADHVVLHVEGMTCGGCVAKVTKALEQAPGVSEATVDLQGKRADIFGDGLDSSALEKMITNLGFKASLG